MENHSLFRKIYAEADALRFSGQYYDAALKYQESTQYNPTYAEAWHNVGAAFIRAGMPEKAGESLREAIRLYQKRILDEIQPGYNLFWMSCVFALLKETDSAFRYLQKAIQTEKKFGVWAKEEEDYEAYWNDPEFHSVLNGTYIPKKEDNTTSQSSKRTSQMLTDSGVNLTQHTIEQPNSFSTSSTQTNSLSNNQLNETQSTQFNAFTQSLGSQNWTFDSGWKSLYDAGIGVSPQSQAEFTSTKGYSIRLALYLEINALSIELINTQMPTDVKIFCLNGLNQLNEILSVFIEYQSILDDENWADLIKKMIPFCEDVLFEMADGVKVRLS